MRYPQRFSIVGLILGIFGILQISLGVLLLLEHFELFSLSDLILELENESVYAVFAILMTGLATYDIIDGVLLVVGISVIISGSMYCAFYVILNQVKQNNAMLKEMYRRMNR